MKKLIYFLITIVFLSSCSIQEPTVTYEKTNASLIHKSIQDLNALENLKSNFSKTDKIAIVGMEDYKTDDYSLLATLEDEIIKEFVVKGYKVLERDDDMVYRLFSEESKNYKYINRVKNAKYGVSATSSNDNYNSYYLYGNSRSNSGSVYAEVKNYDQEYTSTLNSADKIISYRVIESGIIYDYDDKDAEMGEVKREARTILEVRVTNAKTSEILNAITLDGKASDYIEEDDVRALKEFSYRYYSRTLPNTYGNPEETTITQKRNKNGLAIAGGFLGLLLAIISLASG